MNVVFRVDASRLIGSGHVVRCLTLANALRKRGADAHFICREHDGHLCGLIDQHGFPVSQLPPPGVASHIEDASAHAAWLGATWREDAEQTLSVLEGLGAKPDWLIVDHYAVDSRWESCLRAFAGRIMVIDDLADRWHDCDLLLDQNLVEQGHGRYLDKVSGNCGLLLGPEYALLQPIYGELRGRIPPREGTVRRILIFFGGVDRANLTGRAVAAFLQVGRIDIEVDVVVGARCSHIEAIRRQVAGHDNIHLYSGLPSLASLMVKADLAIGAGGTTSWERLCMGLPALVVTLAENQRPIAQALNRHGLIRWLGHWDTVDEPSIALELGKLVQQGVDEDWSVRCFATVDGLGASRVSAALIVNAATPLRARHATLADEKLLLEWANDPVTRHNAFSTEQIDPVSHCRWLRSRLRNLDGCRLYIIETVTGIAIGQVRFELRGQDWETDYALAPVFRRRGLGCPMLAVAMLALRSDFPDALIIGRVKPGNHYSRKVFESLLFDERVHKGGGIVEYRHAAPTLNGYE